jgi:hypothetical protein
MLRFPAIGGICLQDKVAAPSLAKSLFAYSIAMKGALEEVVPGKLLAHG